jgi:hypothetical protein
MEMVGEFIGRLCSDVFDVGQGMIEVRFSVIQGGRKTPSLELKATGKEARAWLLRIC